MNVKSLSESFAVLKQYMQVLASPLRLWKLSVFVQFPLLELFVDNSDRMQVCHQKYLAIYQTELRNHWTPREMTSDKLSDKFHTDYE